MEHDQQAPQGQQKKKRAYAQQAYEFGANASMQQGQALPPMMGGGLPAQPLGMGAQQMPQAPQDQLANQFGQMNLQQQEQQQQQQPQGYPQQSMQQPLQQQMQQPMQQPIQQQQQQSNVGYANQNQLLPSDLIGQPFMVQELDNPPPPINLPPNVRGKF